MKQSIRGFLHNRIGKKGTEEKPSAMRYIWLAVLLCFLAGIIGANLISRKQLGGFGLWNTFFLEKFKYAPIRSADLFYYVLGQRIPVFVALLLFAFTNWGTVAGGLFLAWQSFAAGFLMAASVAVYGVKGMLLIGTAFLPQYLLYIPIYISILYLAFFFRQTGKRSFGKSSMASGRARRLSLILLFAAAALALYITGIFLESYVNPYLLKKILKIF